jgi:cell fate (sporulation/competence/biofilm development) regulator YlbF (YheA/YmcA/DUF963 family)
MMEGVSASFRQAFFDKIYAESMRKIERRVDTNPKIAALIDKILEIALEQVLEELTQKPRKPGFRD